jgi:hypothetical protein
MHTSLHAALVHLSVSRNDSTAVPHPQTLLLYHKQHILKQMQECVAQ